MTTRQLLAGLAVFDGASDEALDALAELAHTGTLDAGEFLFEEGDPATAAFVIASGSVRISRSVGVAADRTLAVLPAGTLFGEAAIIDEATRSAAASGAEPAELLALPRDPMRGWISRFPREGLFLLGHLGRQMMDRMRATNDLLQETVAWGLEVSGASMLSLDRFIAERAAVRVGLASGRTVRGRLVRVDDDDGRGLRLWLAGEDGLVSLLPYHAVEELSADVDLGALHAEATAGAAGLTGEEG